LHLPKQLLQWFEERQSRLCHRQLLVITGQEEWATTTAITLLNEKNTNSILWVGEAQVEYEKINIQNYRSKLGHEYDWVIVNCFSGFRANAAMALSGTIKANGLMIILCPELSKWPSYADPEQINRISFGYQQEETYSFFIQHLISSFREDSSVAILTTDQFSGTAFFVEDGLSEKRYYEQEIAIKSICKVAQGHRNRPLVLTADRGRGKSSSLGIAAAKLMLSSDKTIFVTAPHIHTVEQVFAHNKRLLPDALITKNSVVYQSSSLTFKPLDLLLADGSSADLLLVDEASAIPVHILNKLAKKFPRIVFSSTVHGYEGSGRGFEIKFKQHLAEIKPEFKTLHLSEPIRWFQGDMLEQFWFNTLFHNSISSDNEHAPSPFLIECKEVKQSELLEDKTMLADTFELLVAAHYQTSPDDLQRLLDSPEMKCFVLTQGTTIIGVAQIVEEGGKKLSNLATEIAANARRVKGHLVAQNLASSYNQSAFCISKQWRISRIAILPSHQRKGYGHKLLTYIEQQAKNKKIAFLTTAFGCDLSLLKFWFHLGYSATKLGLKPEVSSGEYSCICIKSLSLSSSTLANSLSTEFHIDLLFYMDKELDELSADVLLELLLNFHTKTHASNNNHILKQFIAGTRNLISCKRHVVDGLLSDISKIKHLNAQDRRFVVNFFLQNKSNQHIRNSFNLTGKKQIDDKAREIMTKIFIDFK